ncbi:hypothetical protein KBD71_05600 [Candidatus Woesebacteria bacterium]|nr:hypothetical protein [Candidatus Woesebacteria bacterium]
MSRFPPGAFKKQLQEKIKAQDDAPAQKFEIKNVDPSSFATRPSAYHAQDRELLAPKPTSSAIFPSASPINKSVHERMKSFVKEQYGKK